MFYKIVYPLPPDELGRDRVENRTYGTIYTNIYDGSSGIPIHNIKHNGLGGTWALIAPIRTNILSKEVFLELRTDAERR